MKSIICSLLIASILSQAAYADIAFVAPNSQGSGSASDPVRLAPYSIVVTKLGSDEVSFELAVEGKRIRHLGARKSYSVSKLNAYSDKYKTKMEQIDKNITRYVIQNGIIGSILGSFLVYKVTSIGGAKSSIWFSAFVGTCIFGLIGMAGTSQYLEFKWVKGDNFSRKAFFTGPSVTNDEPVLYETTDAMIAIADFEKILDDVQ